MFTSFGALNIQRYFAMMKEQIAKEDTYTENNTKLYSDQSTADSREEARSALESERRAINTSRSRSTWRDVKFRSRQNKKVFDTDNKSMDSGLQQYPFSSAETFLAKGNHRTVLYNG